MQNNATWKSVNQIHAQSDVSQLLMRTELSVLPGFHQKVPKFIPFPNQQTL